MGIKNIIIYERALKNADLMIEHNATVRGIAKMTGASKSTVHKDLTQILPELDLEKAIKVDSILSQNKEERHIRGGEATKRKYLKLKVID